MKRQIKSALTLATVHCIFISLIDFASAEQTTFEDFSLDHKDRPIVGDTPWFYSFLECSSCRELYQGFEEYADYYFPMTDGHELMDGKTTKGVLHFICYFMYGGETCMRSIQTYMDLTMGHVFAGVLSEGFFCGPVLHMCSTRSYERATLQFYQERITEAVKPSSLSSNDFVDKYYEQNIRGVENTLQTYQVLHLTDLAIDLQYLEGASTQCREMRCCHRESRKEPNAGPLGATNCDMPLDGARQLLTKLKEKVIEDFNEVNIVVVTGNVVTHQPAQLNMQDHIDTVTQAYAMIQEVFSESFVFPVLGSSDTYPQRFFPFKDTDTVETYHPNMDKSELYDDVAVRNWDAIRADWELNYPFNEQHRQVDSLSFDASISVNEFGYYKVDVVPYTQIDYDVIDADGQVTDTLPEPVPLTTDTMFIALNTLACQADNIALYETLNDPGNQLAWLEATLGTAREDGKTVIIAGNLHPGSPKCNRQWSQRYNSLMDAFQDIVRIQLFAGSSVEHFEIFREAESGNAVGVATTSVGFNGFSSDLSARLFEVDHASNFPIKISTLGISQEQLTVDAVAEDIEVEIRHAYPDSFGMLDLSPSQYSVLVSEIKESQNRALDFLEKGRLGNTRIGQKTVCKEACRTELACSLDYAVNEYTVLCLGYDFSYVDSFWYFVGALENPWYDLK